MVPAQSLQSDILSAAKTQHSCYSACGHYRRPACRSGLPLKVSNDGSQFTMEVIAILLLTVMMVGIGWMANDRGEVRTAGTKAARGADIES